MSKFLNKEFNYLFRFSVGGLLNTIFGYTIFVIFYKVFGLLDIFSIMIVYIIAPFFNYFIQRIYVYQTKLKRRFIYFYGSYLISFLINILIHKISMNLFNPYISQIIGILTATLFTYIITRNLFKF